MSTRTFLRAAVAIAVAAAAFRAHPATITVNSEGDVTADDGACTLREAIVASQSNLASGAMPGECAAGEPLPAVDTIAFAIPGAGLHSILLTDLLPGIVETVVIDGYTQPGATANTLAVGDDAMLRIQIDGSGFSNDLFKLQPGSDGSVVRGLVMNHVNNAYFQIASNGNVVEGNFIATDASGTTFAGVANYAINIVGSNNRVGGTAPAMRNVIASTADLGAATVLVAGTGNVIQGNYIGVDATGTSVIQSDQPTDGIMLNGSAPDTLIGGSEAGAGNVMFASNVVIDVRTESPNVTIQGNYLGTNATGTAGFGAGICISGSAATPNLIIGGPSPLAGNVISGCTIGIQFFSVAEGLVIQGNKIGTDPSGTLPVSNGGPGIAGGSVPFPGLIGGTGPGEGNTVAFNCADGIDLRGAAWTVLGNSMFSNSGVGLNTLLPVFGGPATPSITTLSITAGTATVSGTLDAAASTTYRVEFFSNAVCDASGNGEGRTFVDSEDVTTDAGGHADFGPFNFPVPDGEGVVTATSTDPDGLTSAFSTCAGLADEMFRDGFEGSVCGGGL
jgi:CSLREA domain-containing protein